MAGLGGKIENALNETRMLMLGAQVLVGFQYLSVFHKQFDKLAPSSQDAAIAGLAVLLIAIALLIVPVPYHALVEQEKNSTRFQQFVTRVAMPATLPFAIVMGIDVYIATLTLFGTTPAIITGIAIFIVAIFFWIVFAFLKGPHKRDDKDEEEMPPLDERIQHVLTEARVILPGAQALLGFDFTAFLQDGFEKLPPSSQYLHLASLLLVAIATILLMTPAAYHRIVYHGNDSEEFVRFATGIILIALVPLALALSLDFYVVAKKVTHSTAIASTSAIALLAIFYGMWFGYTTWRARSLRS